MTRKIQIRRKQAIAVIMALITLLAVAPAAFGAKFDGVWTFSITIPDGPKSQAKRTFTVNVDVGPRGDSLHGRVNITDSDGRTVGGAWRIANKKVSITYELPCPEGSSAPCASVILLGKLKNSNTKLKGDVIVMWDTDNDQNPALFDTGTGSFSANRIQ